MPPVVLASSFDIVESLGAFLSSYGAWGVSAVLFVMLIALYYFMSKKNESQIKTLTDLLEKRNNQLISLIQKCSAVIANAASSIEKSEEVMKQTQEVMQDTQKQAKDMERLVDKTTSLIDVCLYKNGHKP